MAIAPDVIILAAGQGERMRSRLPKPLVELAGAPLIYYAITAAKKLRPRRLVVVVPPHSELLQKTAVAAAPGVSVEFVEQPKANGTADAARRASVKLANDGLALVLCADTPLLRPATLQRLLRRADNSGGLSLLSFVAENPAGYGRLLRDADNRIAAVVEEKEGDAKIRAICEVYAGIMAAPNGWLKKQLKRIGDDNIAGEKYLTDLAALAYRQIPIAAVVGEEEELRGVNDAAGLAAAAAVLRRRRADELLARGARLADDERVDVRGEIKTGRDVEIDVNTVFAGKVALGEGCKIGANCVIENCVIGAHTVIAPFCHLQDARIGAHCQIGPFARLRAGTTVKATAKIGNFVEVKNSRIGRGGKASHLSYLGDSTVGDRVNIGAGAITCNYDGRQKHRTIIGDGAFIGSDTQLIAPLRVGRGAFVAAGSTITREVPARKLAIARARQKIFALPDER